MRELYTKGERARVERQPELRWSPLMERWEWEGGYADRHIPKRAGLRWDKDRRVWWTRDAEDAWELRRYADKETLKKLDPAANST